MKKQIFMEIIAVAIGGFIGGALRATMMGLINSSSFPWSTIIVNLSGTFVSALLVIILADLIKLKQPMADFMMIGILGAYTTFSTALVDIIHLSFTLGLAYLLISIVGGVIMVLFSRYIGRKMVAAWHK
ncbi:fluoride efflux transporter FluC [Weissella paramesenteroides]|uniref:fluoride efflux transporter FluC n=1 Tax=Weissella paramesenteroides TaxID=1249 RepID=UPI0013DB6EB2|nr:CrcB family protein [Weissella paramesenteroides]NEZ89057.1 CrcB family protein [Weissella paramesenteroides]NFB03382.1 CrcB family protein [Weissella paramesenteroides]